jgi:predicted transcriptional regulator
MGFLSALKNLLSPEVTTPEMDMEKEREALRRAWGLDPDDPVLAPERADQKASVQGGIGPIGISL